MGEPEPSQPKARPSESYLLCTVSAACEGGQHVDDCAVVQREVAVAHGDDLGRVLDRCSFLLDEVAVRGRDLPLHDGALVDVLPPFAGG